MFFAKQVIDAHAHIRGEVVLKGNVRIDGNIEGKIAVDPTAVITVGPSGHVRCEDLTAGVVEIHGTVCAQSIVADKLVLHPNCTVQGRLKAASIVIHPQARFDGHVTVVSSPIAQKPSSAALAKERLEQQISR